MGIIVLIHVVIISNLYIFGTSIIVSVVCFEFSSCVLSGLFLLSVDSSSVILGDLSKFLDNPDIDIVGDDFFICLSGPVNPGRSNLFFFSKVTFRDVNLVNFVSLVVMCLSVSVLLSL